MKNLTTLELITISQDDKSFHQKKCARQELYNRFRKYIFKFAHQWKTYNHLVTFDSLVSAGQMGLIEAINTFDKSKGVYFSTWAYKNVQLAVWHALREGKSIPSYYKAIGVSSG
ncbi:MAG: sigma factor, partial [Nitrososphaeraceae archaeon]|nr:sigma factor [Nitrososphaeraceae archaeon]